MTGLQWLGVAMLSIPLLVIFGYIAKMLVEDFGWKVAALFWGSIALTLGLVVGGSLLLTGGR